MKPLANLQPKGFAAMGIGLPGRDSYRLLSVGGRVVVFDSPIHAADFMNILCGEDRMPLFSNNGETAVFMPLERNRVNRACIITDYDPYNAPAGLPDIRSEVKGFEWKHHVLHWIAFYDCGQFRKNPDGTVVNIETGMILPGTSKTVQGVAPNGDLYV